MGSMYLSSSFPYLRRGSRCDTSTYSVAAGAPEAHTGSTSDELCAPSASGGEASVPMLRRTCGLRAHEPASDGGPPAVPAFAYTAHNNTRVRALNTDSPTGRGGTAQTK